MTEEKSPGHYVRKVQEDTQHYVQDLLGENKQLRLRVAGLESATSSLEREKARLSDELQSLRIELDRDTEEHERLRRRLADIEEQSHRHSEKYVQVESQNTNLANLYVAGYRLHGTLDREELLQAIQEIIINLVGCEELGIFELSTDEEPELRLAASFGLDADSYRSLPADTGVIGRVVQSAQAFVAGGSEDPERSPHEAHLSACVPLAAEGRVMGAIAIFRLLPQKVDGLNDLDHELLDLLSSQAGIALYATALHARFAAGDTAAGG